MAQHDRDEPARADDLAVLIATIQRRWGTRALQRGTTLHTTPALLPTGIDALDDLLGGGYPRAAITELLGAPTSGTTSIALTALAQAQARGEIGAYVDLGGSFGAEYAAACGVDLATLILVRPASPHDALALLQALVTHQISVLIVNALALLQVTAEHQPLLATGLRRLAQVLPSAPAALLVITSLPYPPALNRSIGYRGSLVGDVAALRLHVAREAWQLDDPQRPQCCSRISVLRRRSAPPDRQCQITIDFRLDGVERP